MKKYLVIFLVTVCAILFFAHFPVHAAQLIRAGGGESFGGGDFSSGGSFGGGFGGSSGFFFLPFFFGGSGGSGSWFFIVIFFFIILPIILRKFGPSMGSSMMNRSQYFRNDTPVTDFSAITQDDPAFNANAFKDHVQTAFMEIQKAWSHKDLSLVRGYMTDAMYQRLLLQIHDLESRGLTNTLESIAIGNVTFVSVTRDDQYESITASIYASMIDYKVNDQGKVVEGSTSIPTKFTEYWTFMRSNKVKTKTSDALVSKTCPNCGAPLDINEAGECKYCHAVVINGEFDWVLSDISQTR